MERTPQSPQTSRRLLPIDEGLGAATALSVVAAALLVVTASAGLLFGGGGLYPVDSELLPQLLGQDAVGLLGVSPALAVSILLARRGSLRALVVWLGTLIYIAYWYHFHIVGIPFGPLFLVHVALVSASLGALGILFFQVDVHEFRRRMGSGMPARTLGRVIAGLGSLFAIAWVADTVMKLRAGASLDPATRAVYAIDLTVMLPMTIVAGVGLWHHRPWGFLLAGPLLVNAFASMFTLLTAAILIDRAGESVSTGQLILFPLATLAMLLCAAVYLRDVPAHPSARLTVATTPPPQTGLSTSRRAVSSR